MMEQFTCMRKQKDNKELRNNQVYLRTAGSCEALTCEAKKAGPQFGFNGKP